MFRDVHTILCTVGDCQPVRVLVPSPPAQPGARVEGWALVRELRRTHVEVNTPLRWGGVTAYQTDWAMSSVVVRVGGGFMSIEEFLSQYADMEMNKVRQMIENGTFNFDDFVEQIAEDSSPNKGAPGHRRAKSKSPRNSGSPRANRQ